MSEHDVQPRVNSESISYAFEQNLKGAHELPLAEKAFGGQDAKPVNRGSASIQVKSFGYSDDPMMAADDEPEDSWLISSPGPPAGKETFKMSPPKEGSSRTSKPPGTRESPTKLKTEQSQKQEESGKRVTLSPAKGVTKIPRVALLGGAKAAAKQAAPTPEKPTSSSTISQGPKGKAVKKTGGQETKRPTETRAQVQKTGFKSGVQSEKLKAAINGRGASIDAKPEEKSGPSRFSSRPTSAASTTSVRTTASQKPTVGKKVPPGVANRSSPNAASTKPSTGSPPAPAKRGNLRAPVNPPGSRRTSRSGQGDKATAPVELLTANSGPEEELTELAEAEAEERSQDSEPQMSSEEDRRPVSQVIDELRAEKNLQQPAILDQTEAVDRAVQKSGTPPKQRQEASEVDKQTGSPPLSVERRISVQGSEKATKPPTPKPEWVDIVPPPEYTDAEVLSDEGIAGAQASEAGPGLKESSGSAPGSVQDKPAQVSATPFAAETIQVVDDVKSTAESRPGVGRKKAAELPHDGYSKPAPKQKGCCGCVVM